MPDSAVFPGTDAVFDPGVDPVGGVDVGGLAAPAAGPRWQVGDLQGVAPAVFGLEQGQLGAGVRALAACSPGPGSLCAGRGAAPPGQRLAGSYSPGSGRKSR
jgi:hypothetical protein